jgi:hypothetical protein
LWRVLAHDKLIICRQHFLDDAQAVYNPGLLLFLLLPEKGAKRIERKKKKMAWATFFINLQ